MMNQTQHKKNSHFTLIYRKAWKITKSLDCSHLAGLAPSTDMPGVRLSLRQHYPDGREYWRYRSSAGRKPRHEHFLTWAMSVPADYQYCWNIFSVWEIFIKIRTVVLPPFWLCPLTSLSAFQGESTLVILFATKVYMRARFFSWMIDK